MSRKTINETDQCNTNTTEEYFGISSRTQNIHSLHVSLNFLEQVDEGGLDVTWREDPQVVNVLLVFSAW